MEELVLPIPADRTDGIEMARVWITSEEGQSYLSLKFGMFEDKELEIWGSLAADLVAHAVNAYLQDGGEFGKDAALAAVEAPGASICARLDAQQGQLPSVVLRLTGGRQD